MSKVTLEFDSVEDREELKLALAASTMHSILWDLDQFLRAKLKYEELTEERAEAFQTCREKFWELSKDHGFDLYN